MPSRERIVAVGLLTQSELELLGPQFQRAFLVDETPCFGELLHAIDEADRQLWRERDLADRERHIDGGAPLIEQITIKA